MGVFSLLTDWLMAEGVALVQQVFVVWPQSISASLSVLLHKTEIIRLHPCRMRHTHPCSLSWDQTRSPLPYKGFPRGVRPYL